MAVIKFKLNKKQYCFDKYKIYYKLENDKYKKLNIINDGYNLYINEPNEKNKKIKFDRLIYYIFNPEWDIDDNDNN